MESTSTKVCHSILVKKFTEQSLGKRCPEFPLPMSKDEVKFLISMIKSELWELAATVSENYEESISLVSSMEGIDTNRDYKRPITESGIIAEQADALVDIYYYSLNALVKKGVNLEPIFQAVHKSNMDKRFPDGEFHRRDDGKIIKPNRWREPDITGLIEQMKREGSW